MKEILKALGYEVKSRRDEGYLTSLAISMLKEAGVAAVHLDEVQDSGRYKTKESMEVFLKIFRNLMQHKEWLVCLKMTATPEAKCLINSDSPLLRRVFPQEIGPIDFEDSGVLLKETLQTIAKNADVPDYEIFDCDEFLKILIHA